MTDDDRRIHGYSEEACALICALLGIRRDELKNQHIRRVELTIDVSQPVTLHVERFSASGGVRTATQVAESLVLESRARWADVTSLGDSSKQAVEA